MIKKFFFLMVLSLGLINFTGIAEAHSVLESSNPKQNEVVKQSLSQITITFNTKVEKGSRFYVVNQDGTKRNPDQIKLNKNQMTGIFNQPLANGTYSVKWEIIGADGHPVNGSFSFQIDIPGEKNGTEKGSRSSEGQVNDKKDGTLGEEKNDSAEMTKAPGPTKQATIETQKEIGNQTPDNNQNIPPILTGFIVFLGVVALVTLFWLLLKKSS